MNVKKRTFSERVDSEQHITAIILEDAENDVYIKSVMAGHSQEYIDELGLNLDYSMLHQGIKGNYIFFCREVTALEHWRY